ncbi:MAG TPA: hypothetical protein VNP20_11350 [Nocardioidaceae bacterium]|nr:hypothetical protein [Nocardioidaceae bacterium]
MARQHPHAHPDLLGHSRNLGAKEVLAAAGSGQQPGEQVDEDLEPGTDAALLADGVDLSALTDT